MAKPCRYQLPGQDTWMSEQELMQKLNDGLLDKFMSDNNIAVRNFKFTPNQDLASKFRAPQAEVTPAPVAEIPQAEVKPTETPKSEETNILTLDELKDYKKRLEEKKAEKLNWTPKKEAILKRVNKAIDQKESKEAPVAETETPTTKTTTQPVETKTSFFEKKSPIDEELDRAIIDMENIQEEIDIEKDNIREEKERIKEEKAKVRASKMSRAEKQDKLEDLDAELQDYIDNAEGTIENLQSDLKAAKSDVKKIENRKAKTETKSEPATKPTTQPAVEPVAEVKEGVQELFESNPELAAIGTQEQYSQYLDAIFPDSKVKDIVYHGSNYKFDTFEKRVNPQNKYKNSYKAGWFFAKDKNTAKAYIDNKISAKISNFLGISKDKNPTIYPVILDIKNPIIEDRKKRKRYWF